MALTKNFATLDPNVSSADQEVSVSVTNNDGRQARSVTTTVQTTDGSNISKQVTIRQAGRPLFVEIDTTRSSTVVAQNGQSVVNIYGTSNAQKLAFTLSGQIQYNYDSAVVSTLASNYPYTAGGVSQVNNVALATDPGLTGSYEFCVTIENFTANTGVTELTSLFTAKASASGSNDVTDSCTIRQSAGDAYLAVYDKEEDYDEDKSSISGMSFSWDGTPTSGDQSGKMYVRSNTSWKIV